ncbi:hypothetical protein ACWA06_06465 [Serratia rhizosphaerae]
MNNQNYSITSARKFEFYHELYIESMLVKLYERVYIAIMALQVVVCIIAAFGGLQARSAAVMMAVLVAFIMIVNPQRKALKAKSKESKYVEMIAFIESYSDDELINRMCSIADETSHGRALVEKSAYLQAAHYLGATEQVVKIKEQLSHRDKLVAFLSGGLPM